MPSEKDIYHYKKCLEISTANRNPLGIASSNGKLGNAYVSIGEYKKAIYYFKKGLEIWTAIGDWSGIAEINDDLGYAYFSLEEYENAIEYYKKGLEICTAIGDRSAIAITNCKLGTAFFRLGEYVQAIDYSKKALEISTAIGDRSSIASSNWNLGNAYVSIGEYEKAINYFKKSLEISIAIGDRLEIGQINGNLGNAYLSLGEYEKAIKYSEKGLEICTAIGDRSGIAIASCNFGNASFRLGKYEEAIDYFKKSLKNSTAISDRSAIASSNCNLGNVYCSKGEYEKAIDYYKKSLEIFSSLRKREGIAKSFGSLGNAYRCLGEYEKAINYSKKCLEICTAIGDQSGIAGSNSNLGSVYISIGEYGKAIEYFEKSLGITNAIGNRSAIASMNGNVGNVYLRLGKYEKAIDNYRKGLKIATAIGDQSVIANSHGNLGNAYRCLGEYGQAISCFKKCLEICTTIGDQPGIATHSINLGNLYICIREYKKAIEYYEESLEISTAIGIRSGIAINNGNLGNAYLCLGEYREAKSHLMKSINLFDRIFLNSVPDQNKLSFTEEYVHFHKILMTCFISLERIESALLVIDLGRAKELHCCIEKQQDVVKKDMFGYARATWNRIENREEQIGTEEIQKFLQIEDNDASILVFAFDLEDFLNVWILNSEVIFRASKLDPGLEIFLSLIKQFLGRVDVNVNRNSSFSNRDSVANLNNQGTIPLEMPSRKPAPQNAVENTACDAGDFSNREILGKLWKHVIDPVRDVIKGNRLIIVPDKQLFFVPFSSFIDENGYHLSHSYSIQITPSLHTLKSSMERTHDSNLGFALFVGNPTVGNVSLNGEEFTPFNLPSATEEVKCLSKLFEARPFLGREATKQLVLQHLSGASIIHIAAHGEPNRGEIMLAPNPSPTESVSKPESYLLTQRDIMNISVEARLVVLCCCHTGQGEVSSEGVIGITRAFLAAGARSVLATLWPIDDFATKEFMEKFYAELFQETSVCEALKRTMNLFQKHEKEEYRSIKIWAPFTIYGEDVKFQKDDIEKIREKSREMFTDIVILPNVGDLRI